MSEIWKLIPGYDGNYMASSLGRIKSLARIVTRRSRWGDICQYNYKERILSPSKSSRLGHLAVTLSDNGRQITRSLHRLVLEAFVGPCPEGMECCHNNGIASDNRPENLRWDTHYANNQDRKKHGTDCLGSRHGMARITEEQAAAILVDPRTAKEICAAYSVTKQMVYSIKSYKAWKHIGGTAVKTPGRTLDTFRRGESHHRAKMTKEKVIEIRQDGRSQDKIAAAYGITQSSVWAIINRKSWAHV